MKNFIMTFAALIFAASLLSMRTYALEAPEIISESAVLMDAETGQVLYQKKQDKRMYPASTTKIMTGLLVAENCKPEEIAKTSASAIDIDEWDSANIALMENEEMSVDSLMYAMMMPSANDASNVLAEHVAGSQSGFVAMMNERARSIGATSTHFANAHGLHDPAHYTTAYDLALITREALRNKVFVRYFGASVLTIPPTNLNPYERPFTNYQYMLVDATDYYYPEVTGGKVGYTYEAEHTMSTVAERDGRKLICTVMKSPNRGDKFEDTKTLLDFGFDEFVPLNVERERFPGFEEAITDNGAEIGVADFRSVRDFKALLHNSLDPASLEISYTSVTKAADAKNDTAYAEFRINSGNEAIPALLGRASLERSAVMYQQTGPATILNEIATHVQERPWIIPLVMFLAVFGLFLLFNLINSLVEAANEKRRRQRLEEIEAAEEAAERTRYSGPIPVVGKQFLTR